jgi:transcriptional regulator with XRE-family HTH domain
MAKKQLFSDQLRKAVEGCGVTRYRISKDLGISESLLSRFVHSDIGLSLSNIDKICEYIGARLVVDGPNSKRKGR